MKNQIERIENQLRWLHYSKIAVEMLKSMPKQEIVKENEKKVSEEEFSDTKFSRVFFSQKVLIG